MSNPKKNFAQYLQDLKSEDPKNRINAVIMLGEWGGEQAIPPLIESLKHSDENLRRESIRALKEINNKCSIEPLLNLLGTDSSVEVRAEAAFALAYFNKFNFDTAPLILALDDNHYLVRQNVAFALGRVRSRKSVKKMVEVLENDDNYNVREMVAWALGEIKDKRASLSLLNSLNDSHINVRKNAAFALGKLQEPLAVESLKKQILKEGESKEAAWALSKILKKKAVIEILVDAYRRLKKENKMMNCLEICRLIYQIDIKEAEKIITEMLQDRKFSFYHQQIKQIK